MLRRVALVNELKNRGVEDVFIVCCDGLKGFPEAIEAVFPKTVVQTCIVHMIRNSTRYVSYKDRRAVCADLKPIYTAVDRDAALAALILPWLEPHFSLSGLIHKVSDRAQTCAQ